MNIKVGMVFYDCANGRYIHVYNVDKSSKTASCDVIEIEWDEDTDTEREIKSISLFTFTQLSHFEQR